jgi:aminomethyltransferase
MVPFSGWNMPVQYNGIVEEHKAVRERAGLFDVSHMGRFVVRGPGALSHLDGLTTNAVSKLAIGQFQYSSLPNAQGGLVDDILVGRTGRDEYQVVVNAGNLGTDRDLLRTDLPAGTEFVDESLTHGILALQGPDAASILLSIAPDLDTSMATYHVGWATVAGVRTLVSRTGYTGEDGFELSLGASVAPAVWEVLLQLGEPLGIVPTGLGARDTLRLEAGMPLYGHELSEQIDPFQAGLGFACHLVGYDFPGRDALLRRKNQPPKSVRIGVELSGKRAARQGSTILAAGRPIGQITSGSYSPSLGKPIAMGYVPPAFAQVGTELHIDIRGQLEPARVVELPFYRRNKFANGSRASK